jgi:serine protease Do
MKPGVFIIGLTLAVAGAASVAAQDRVAPRRDMRIFGLGGAQLGIRVSDTTNGVRVDDVNPDSPAQQAGIREGDLVVEFDGERVRSAMQLTRLVRETPEGRQVAVAVMRDGKRQALQATPEAGRAFAFDEDSFRELERGWRDLPRRFEAMPFMGSRGRLGVTVQSLTPDLEEYFGAKNGGALVSSVAPGSAAADAGIKAGDVITSINGRQVSDADDLTRGLRDLTGAVTIVLLRDRKELTLQATIARNPPPEAGAISASIAW